MTRGSITRAARRRDRLVPLAGGLLLAGVLVIGWWAGREPPRPAALTEVTLAVQGLH